MPYFLRTQTTNPNEYLTLPPLTIGSGDDFVLELKVKANSSDFLRPLGTSTDLVDRVLIFPGIDPTVRLQFSTATLNFTTTGGIDPTSVNVYRFVRSGGSVELLINGVSQGAQASNEDLPSSLMFRQDATNYGASADLYYLKVEVNGVPSRLYDPSASVGQGVLVDTAGGSNATPVNFPPNFDDALVFYEDSISIPVESRTTYTKIYTYLLSQDYRGDINDVLNEWLEGEGYSGAFNDKFYGYLEAQGFSGALPDMRTSWRKDVTPSNWILATGVWNDGGNWQDGETWSDS